MEKFLKENWFKLTIIFIILIICIGYFYIAIRKHNATIINNIVVNCIEKALEEDGTKKCIKIYKNTGIFINLGENLEKFLNK